jgi:hypothetical protein
VAGSPAIFAEEKPMNRLIVAIAIFAVAGLQSFGMQAQADETPGMGQMAHKNPEMMKQMSGNPHHMLAMAYHDNLMTFSHQLMKMAKQGETVPREFARTAVAEMRRSVDEIEKHHAEAMRSMQGMKEQPGDMRKKMEQHMASVKGHLRDLEELTKKDRIASQDVLKHLNAMMEECEGMECGTMGDMSMDDMSMDGQRHGHGHGQGHEGKPLRDCTGCPCGDKMPMSGEDETGSHHHMKDVK